MGKVPQILILLYICCTATSLKIENSSKPLNKFTWESLTRANSPTKKLSSIEWDDDEAGNRHPRSDALTNGGWTKVSSEDDSPSQRPPDKRYSNAGDTDAVSAIQHVDGPSSQWKPVDISNNDEARSLRTHREVDRKDKYGSDWRPVSSEATATKVNLKTQSSFRLAVANSAIEEPFDAEFDKVNESNTDSKINRDSYEHEKVNPEAKWKPVVNENLPSNTNQSETAQKSASDINYIYSSQADGSWTSAALNDARPNSNGYSYSYQQPITAQPQAQIDQQNIAIVDTVSGAMPETINDRAVEPATIDWASQQTTRATQDSPNSGYYDNYSYSFTAPKAQQSPVRQVSSPVQQPIRQENHYHHYYMQQAPQQPERQVRREVQPLVISQPIIQQVPSPALQSQPQVIREIIKEVPVPMPPVVAPIPLPTRFIMAPPSNQKPTREVDYPYANRDTGYSTAQRSVPLITRQIAQPIRIQPIQLPPLRIATPHQAPVTRQTASFVIPPMPKKTTTYMTETQAVPMHTTIMHTTQFTPATKTTIFTTDHQPQVADPAPEATRLAGGPSMGYK